VAVAGSYAYTGSSVFDMMRAINIVDPAHMSEVGSYEAPSAIRELAATGSTVYLAGGQTGLHVISAATPATPALIGRYDGPAYSVGVTVADQYAYVADDVNGLRIVDVSDAVNPIGSPAHWNGPVIPSRVQTESWSAGDTPTWRPAPVGSSSPTSPTRRTPRRPECSRSRRGRRADVAVAGAYAYVAAGAQGLYVVSIADPAHPSQVGMVDTAGDPWAWPSRAITPTWPTAARAYV